MSRLFSKRIQKNSDKEEEGFFFVVRFRAIFPADPHILTETDCCKGGTSMEKYRNQEVDIDDLIFQDNWSISDR